MFDIGFFELSLIGVVALVVIGPERLPAVARTAGKWVGRVNRFVSSVKEDISKELKDEELKNIIQQQKELANEFKQVAEETGSAINKLNQTDTLEGILEIDESTPADSDNTLNSTKSKKKKKKKKKKSANKKLSDASQSTDSAKDTAAKAEKDKDSTKSIDEEPDPGP